MRWSVPDGFTVAPEPSILDVSLVDRAVYMRWETYGWQMGKITGIVTSATPRLVKKFNSATIVSWRGVKYHRLDAR